MPSDPADPAFNIAQLWWNATNVPFSPAWWNAPHFFPSRDVAAFTENLVGLYPIFSPLYWVSGNPIVAFNIAYFLTWPLSAITAFLLVQFLTRREDAAFVAGLAYGFSPYRTAEIAHIQSLSSFYLPLCLFGLHGFLSDARPQWLWMFGTAWLLQSFANGYYMLFGGVLIALWLLYFCSTRLTWRRGVVAFAVWVAASLPLLAVMLKYFSVYAREGFSRSPAEIVAFAATARSWFEVTGDTWLWRSFLLAGKDNLFPGLTVLALILAAVSVFVSRGVSDIRSSRSSAWPLVFSRWALITGIGVGLIALGITLWNGPWSTTIVGRRVRVNGPGRAVFGIVGLSAVLTLLTPRLRDALKNRSPVVFYTGAVVLIVALCFGPSVRTPAQQVLSAGPYGLLLHLPGFNQLRVTTRFWMLGVLCLSVAAGICFALLWRRRSAASIAALVVVALGVLLDGWMPEMRMVPRPVEWPAVESRARTEPLIELPLGPDWDFPATFRAAGHRRRIVNGISGYDPSHYIALREALERREPDALVALASLAAIDVVVSKDFDADGELERYVARTPGASREADDGKRVLYRIEQAPAERQLGPTVPIASVEGFRYAELFSDVDRHVGVVFDGRVDTGWQDHPQQPGQWLIVDLGSPREIAGLTHALGDSFLDFPRRLAIEVSLDGHNWTRVWEGPTAARAFLALVRGPREGAMRFAFPTTTARYIRLLQIGTDPHAWHIAELTVHAPDPAKARQD